MFKFTKSSIQLTEADLKKAEDRSMGGKFLEPGIHSVKIIEAEFFYKDGSCMNTKDPTWATVMMTFENAAKLQKKHYQLIPTSKLLFNEGNSKAPEFVFMQFNKLCIGLGIEMSVDPAILTKSMTKYFADPKKLIGMTCDIELQYKGPYVNYLAKDQYQLCKADGTVISSDIFDDKAKALLKAVDLKLKIEGFAEIVKFFPKKSKVVKEAIMPETTDNTW